MGREGCAGDGCCLLLLLCVLRCGRHRLLLWQEALHLLLDAAELLLDLVQDGVQGLGVVYVDLEKRKDVVSLVFKGIGVPLSHLGDGEEADPGHDGEGHRVEPAAKVGEEPQRQTELEGLDPVLDEEQPEKRKTRGFDKRSG